jgi:predicted cobalt transporter CbtA
MTMVGNLLLRGMLVGVVAGTLAFGFARLFGEPQIDRAIAFEEQMSKAKGSTAEPELVSREVQGSLGLFTGVVVYGAAIGGLFSLVFASAYGRVGRIDPRALSALLALAGFVAIVLVPAIKYSPNPPSIGDSETIGIRTGLYFAMLLLSVATLVLAVILARNLLARFGAWNAAIIAGAVFILAIALIQNGLPTINEVPDQFSAVLLWQFRVVAIGIQMVLWTTIGLLFGYVAERCLTPSLSRQIGTRSSFVG